VLPNVCRFLHLGTTRVILSRDITWLGKMYGEWKGLDNMHTVSDHTEETTDDDDYSVEYLNQIATPPNDAPPTVPLPIPIYHDDDTDPATTHDNIDVTDFEKNHDNVFSTSTTSTISSPLKKLMYAMRKPTSFYNPTANKIYNKTIGNDDADNIISAKESDEGNSENTSQHTNDNSNDTDSNMDGDNSDELANIIVDRSAIKYALPATVSKDNPDNIPMSSYKDVYEFPNNFDYTYNHPIKW
jgi:hypothetical protein